MGARIESIDDSNVQRMYYEEHMTQQEIADYYGVSQGCIYWRLNLNKLKEYSKNQREERKEYIREYLKVYQQTDKGKDEIERASEKFWKTDKGKLLRRKHNAFRRSLCLISLNEPFDESEFHHYNKTHGIYMPAEIHQSIYHNLKTGQGMDAINKEAFEFLEWELREKQWEEITGDWIVGEY